jgi:hypothetical protein
MNRRTFIQAAGLGFTRHFGSTERGQPISVLLKLLEDSPRERIVRELVRMIRAGLRYEDLLAALSLAAVRNVQPYPDVGFKYHSVLVLRSIHLATQHLAAADKWLPIIWATDYFKHTQAQERATGGWRLPMKRVAPGGNPQAARRELATALDNWDPDAADAAIVKYVRAASPDEIFSLLFPYGARDLRAIGHKAITVSNAHSLIALLGSAQAEPILRSTVAALQNSGGGPNPANQELPPDQPWRRNQQQLQNIPQSWSQGRDDPGARSELHAALYRVAPEEAGAVVAEFLRRRLSPGAIWQVLFDVAAELLMHEPSIVLLHAQTTANALHYAYRVCGNEQTQQLMLLQCAAFITMFREMTGTIQPDLGLEALQSLPLEGVDAIGEIFSDLSTGHRLQAVRKSLGYLQKGGDAEALIATARHHLVYNADEAHDYKFSEAVFDGYSHLSDLDWRQRFLSAGMAYFKAPRKRPSPLVEETMELLHG